MGPITAIFAKAHGLTISDGEQLCDDCHGSGRYRFCWGSDYCERRDTVTCPNCDGKGKHKIGQPHRGMFDILGDAEEFARAQGKRAVAAGARAAKARHIHLD